MSAPDTSAPAAAATSSPKRIGEMLIARNVLTVAELDQALELQKERPGDKLGKILVDLGFVAQREVLAALADQWALPLVTIEGAPPSSPELDKLTPRFLKQFHCVPVALDESGLTLAMADPLDFETLTAVTQVTGLKVRKMTVADHIVVGEVGFATWKSSDAFKG